MQKYELFLTLPGTFDDLQAEQKLSEITDIVKQLSKNVEVTALGKNRLAYPVKQIRYGYLYTMVFESTGTDIKTLEQKLQLKKELLRATISKFTSSLSQVQCGAYAADDLALTTISERKDGGMRKSHSSDTPTTFAPAAAPAEKAEEKVDLEGIKKKLDQIIDETDIIPGV
jgi:ribosomal protein S6